MLTDGGLGRADAVDELRKVAEQLASYLVVIHFTEICLKHQALSQGSVGRGFFVEAASGNAILGCLLLAAIALDYLLGA